MHEFVANWRANKLPGLSKDQLRSVLANLNELSSAAMQAGFRRHLTNACRPYRNLDSYIQHLHDIETAKPGRS